MTSVCYTKYIMSRLSLKTYLLITKTICWLQTGCSFRRGSKELSRELAPQLCSNHISSNTCSRVNYKSSCNLHPTQSFYWITLTAALLTMKWNVHYNQINQPMSWLYNKVSKKKYFVFFRFLQLINFCMYKI